MTELRQIIKISVLLAAGYCIANNLWFSKTHNTIFAKVALEDITGGDDFAESGRGMTRLLKCIIPVGSDYSVVHDYLSRDFDKKVSQIISKEAYEFRGNVYDGLNVHVYRYEGILNIHNVYVDVYESGSKFVDAEVGYGFNGP